MSVGGEQRTSTDRCTTDGCEDASKYHDGQSVGSSGNHGGDASG